MAGISALLLRKIPALAELSEVHGVKTSWKAVFAGAITCFRKIPLIRKFSAELFLHKFLSKCKVFTLRAENKINIWLVKLRQRSQKKKLKDKDDFWGKIK